MDLIRKIPKKFTKKFGNKVINRQYFRRRTGLNFRDESSLTLSMAAFNMGISKFGYEY